MEPSRTSQRLDYLVVSGNTNFLHTYISFFLFFFFGSPQPFISAGEFIVALLAGNELFGTVVTWPVSCTPAGSPALSELLGSLMKGRVFTQKVQYQILMVKVTRLVGTDDMVYKSM